MRLLTDRTHVGLFRVLLRAYPRSFRAEFGREMTELFAARLERSRSVRRSGSTAAFWMRTLADGVMSSVAERWVVWRGGRGPGMGYGRRRASMVDRLVQDVGIAVRRLARSPAFTLAAVAIAALGIGANAASFSLVDALLFRPLPFADAGRVMRIYQDSDDGDPSSSSYPSTRDMAEFTDVFSGVAAWSPDQLTWEAEEGPRPVAVEYVTANYMDVLGLAPSLGRWFEPAYDRVGAGAYAVLSRATWKSKFGADPGVVGGTIRLNGQPVTVLGVGPDGFNGSGGALVTDAWLSISSTPLTGSYRVENLERREDHWYLVWARLAPGVTQARAQSAMDGLAERLAEDYPELNKGRGITVFRASDIRIHPDADGSVRTAGTVLTLVMGLVLLLACSNLAGLLLVRGMSRTGEVAVRRALGASRGRVAGLLLTEALLLAVAGGAVGLLLARWVIAIVPGLPIPLPAAGTLDLELDGRVLLFTLALVVVTGGLFGLVPALRSAGTDLAGTLRRDARLTAHGRRVPFFRNAMLVVQVAVSLVLLVGSALLVRSLSNLSTADPGVDAERVAYISTIPSRAGLSAEQSAVVVDELLARFAAIPGVTRVALASRLPVQDQGGTSTTVIEGYDPPTGTGSVELLGVRVSGDYFRTLGLRIVAGRGFTDADRTGPPVAIVNETAARRYWGTTDVVGRRMRPQGVPDGWTRVVGVVADSKVRAMGETTPPFVYRPLSQASGFPIYLLARTPGDAGPIVDALRRELRATNAALPVAGIGTLDGYIRSGLAPPRLAATALGGFSAIALLLTALGIYAVLSFGVARRSAELGIRMALGAARGAVIAGVVGEVLLTVVSGLVVGFVVAGLAAVRLENLLFDVRGLDPLAFLAAAVVLILIAGVAAFVPARRAVAIDPVEALRSGT